jgi:hypothetical protein
MSDDRAAIEQLKLHSAIERAHTVLHYLYFPSREGASSAAIDLQARGFEVEERLGADGVNWLVLARHRIVPTEAAIAAARRIMEDLTHPQGGEYDGWEAEIA